MRAREYAYLQIRFPRILKTVLILFSDTAYYFYAIFISALATVSVGLPDKTFINIFVYIFAFILLVRVVKGLLKWLFAYLGVILYSLFYPKKWVSNPLKQPMSSYYNFRSKY